MSDDQREHLHAPSSNGGTGASDADGVSASPDADSAATVQGRTSAGESGGGAYPNPHTGRKPTHGGFMGHGGQTNIGYHGSGQAGNHGRAAPNAATRGNDDYTGQGAVGPKPSRTVPASE